MADITLEKSLNSPVAGFKLAALFARKKRLRKLREGLIEATLFLCAIFSVFVTLGIIFSLFGEGIAFFLRPEVSLWKYVTGTTWRPLVEPAVPENFGILPLVNGTLMIAVLASVVALPLGLGSAVLLSEYVSEGLRSILKPVLEILAGIPTVVYGYFALSFITPLFRDFFSNWFNPTFGTNIKVGLFNAVSAAFVVGVMIIPTIASLSEDAMRSVPRALREGAYALGATRFETSTKVVVPAALSGIIASFILGISRAVGETMAVTIAAGATPRVTLNPLDSIQTMTSFIVQVSFGDAPLGSINSQSIFAVGATLFLMTFFMNWVSQIVMKRFREEYE